MTINLIYAVTHDVQCEVKIIRFLLLRSSLKIMNFYDSKKKLALELNRRRLLSTYAIVYVRHRKYLLICQAFFGESNLSLNTRLEGKRTEEF